MSEWIKVKSPQVGDLASHKFQDLDSREVVKVEGSNLWLLMAGAPAGPFQIRNYTFKRQVGPDKAEAS